MHLQWWKLTFPEVNRHMANFSSWEKFLFQLGGTKKTGNKWGQLFVGLPESMESKNTPVEMSNSNMGWNLENELKMCSESNQPSSLFFQEPLRFHDFPLCFAWFWALRPFMSMASRWCQELVAGGRDWQNPGRRLKSWLADWKGLRWI